MSEPTTEAGRAASKAIKSGMLGMWADDPDDPIGSMVASIEAEARATLLAELRAKVEDLPTWDKRSVPGGFHVNRAAVLALLDEKVS